MLEPDPAHWGAAAPVMHAATVVPVDGPSSPAAASPSSVAPACCDVEVVLQQVLQQVLV